MALTRRTILVLTVLAIAIAAGGVLYFRHRVNTAVAECDTPAPPGKPATPPPNLPGFADGAACGPGETAKSGAAVQAGTKR